MSVVLTDEERQRFKDYCLFQGESHSKLVADTRGRYLSPELKKQRDRYKDLALAYIMVFRDLLEAVDEDTG